MGSCTFYYPLGQDEISVVRANKMCHYHRYRQNFLSTMISPDALCPAAFNVLYSHCLSMLSRGKYPKVGNKEICKVICPGKPGTVEFNIFRRPNIRNGIEKLIFYFKKIVDFFIPVELLEHNVFIEVVRTSDHCPFSYKEGVVFKFNIGDKKEICPASFYSLYPFYLSFLDNRTDLNNSNFNISCPDFKTNIVFQLGSQSKESNCINKQYFSNCDDYSNIYIRVNYVRNCNYSMLKEGTEYNVNQLIKDMGIPCFSVFYNAFPYMLSLKNEGSLGFLTFDRNAAGIQCPNSSSQVKLFVKKDIKQDLYFLNIIGSKDKCPKVIRRGQIYELPNFSNKKFDIVLLANIFPYVMYLKYLVNFNKKLDKKIIFSYSNEQFYIELQIYKKEEIGAS